MVASNINIFAREMTGGVRMDEFLMASGTMTNCTVSGYMQGMAGSSLTMTYPRGKSTIWSRRAHPHPPAGAVKRAALATGMQIVVRGMAEPGREAESRVHQFDGPVKL